MRYKINLAVLFILILNSVHLHSQIDSRKVYLYPCLISYKIDDNLAKEANVDSLVHLVIIDFSDTIDFFVLESCIIINDSNRIEINTYRSKNDFVLIKNQVYLLKKHPNDIVMEGLSYTPSKEDLKVGRNSWSGVYLYRSLLSYSKTSKAITFLVGDFNEFTCQFKSIEEFNRNFIEP